MKKVLLLTFLVAVLFALGFSAVRYSDAASLESFSDQIEAGLRKARLLALELNKPVVFALKNDCNYAVTPLGRPQAVLETVGVSIGKSCGLSNQSSSVTFLANGHVFSKGAVIMDPIRIKVSDTYDNASKEITINTMGLATAS